MLPVSGLDKTPWQVHQMKNVGAVARQNDARPLCLMFRMYPNPSRQIIPCTLGSPLSRLQHIKLLFFRRSMKPDSIGQEAGLFPFLCIDKKMRILAGHPGPCACPPLITPSYQVFFVSPTKTMQFSVALHVSSDRALEAERRSCFPRGSQEPSTSPPLEQTPAPLIAAGRNPKTMKDEHPPLDFSGVLLFFGWVVWCGLFFLPKPIPKAGLTPTPV